MLSVFLVDDESLIRRGLKKLINWEELGFKISGEASNGEEALELISADNTDIVITDLKMPAMDGLELTATLKKRLPGIKVIVLTGFDDFSYMQQSIRNNVVDYLLKPVNAGLLTESLLKIREQIDNETYPYPFILESRLIEELENLDGKRLLNTMDELFDEFQKHKVPLKIVKKICENILISINLYLEKQGLCLGYILGRNIDLDNYLGGFSSKEDIKNELIAILCTVIEYKSGRRNKNGKMIEQIKGYMEKNLHENITLATLASKFYMNPTYLSQLFKSETGENYVDFLMKLRVEKAKELLKNKDLRIQDVCEIVGYNDTKYFAQLFKKQVGMLPSEYRLWLNKKAAAGGTNPRQIENIANF